jgi:membrane-bound ClpP family serine protease
MGTELVWPSLCLAIGLILLIAEVFIPSGGLIGLLALGFLIVSLWLAFATSTALGFKFLLALGILVPIALAAAVHLWPRTPIGRHMMLKPPSSEDLEPDSGGVVLAHLVGQFGRALTPLRPSGLVDFEGRRLEGLSEEGLIPIGALVRAVQVRSGRIIVRPVRDPIPGDPLV